MRAEERKAQILQAAMECFSIAGFHQTTMDDIARRAGISPALIYRRFKGKEDLIESLTEQAHNGSKDMMARALEMPTIIEALDFVFEKSLQEADTLGLIPFLAQITAEAFLNPRIAELLRRDKLFFLDFFTQLIQKAQDRGEADSSLPAKDAAFMLMTFTDGFLFQMGLDQAWERMKDPRYIRLFKQMYARFLRLKGSDEYFK